MVLSFSPCCPSLPLPHWPLHLCNVKPPITAALPWEKPHNLFFKTKQCHLPSITADKEPSFISQTAHSLFAECVQCFFLEPLNSFSILWLVEKCMLLSFRPVYSILRRANPSAAACWMWLCLTGIRNPKVYHHFPNEHSHTSCKLT